MSIITTFTTKYISCKINQTSSFIGSNHCYSKKLLNKMNIFLFKMMKLNIFPFYLMEALPSLFRCLKINIILNCKLEMILDNLTYFFSASNKKILFWKMLKKRKILKDFSHYRHKAIAKFTI